MASVPSYLEMYFDEFSDVVSLFLPHNWTTHFLMVLGRMVLNTRSGRGESLESTAPLVLPCPIDVP